MVRRKSAELDVRIAFEGSRTAPQCLAEAYERLVPIARRPKMIKRTMYGRAGFPLLRARVLHAD